MAKKRKVRSSDPEVVPTPKKPLHLEPPPKLEPEEETILIKAEEPQMPVDHNEADSEDEVEYVEDEDEEEEAAVNPALGKALTAMLTSQEAAGPATASLLRGLEDQMKQQQNEEEDDEPVEKLLEPFTREQLVALVKQAIDTQPGFATNVRTLADADPAQRKILVHGLGWDTTAEILISEFSKHGEIEDCNAVTDRVSGMSKGHAFILFKRRSGARAALKEPQKWIGSRLTSSRLASAGPVPATGSSAGPVPATGSSAAPASEYTQRKIFVGNVTPDVDPAKLLEFFQQFGEVEEGPLGMDRHTGKPKGFALFVYRTLESAKKSLEEPRKTFQGLTLQCHKAVDRPKQSKGYGNSHHSNSHGHHYQQPQAQFHAGMAMGRVWVPTHEERIKPRPYIYPLIFHGSGYTL